VCSGLQHSVVTADDREKGHRPFFVPHFFARRFAHIGSRFVSITDGQCLRGRISACFGLKMNTSGTTTYVQLCLKRQSGWFIYHKLTQSEHHQIYVMRLEEPESHQNLLSCRTIRVWASQKCEHKSHNRERFSHQLLAYIGL